MKIKDLMIGCLFLFISCLFFIATFSFPTPPVQAAGPAFWPQIMSITLGVFALALISKSIYELKKEKKVSMSRAKKSSPKVDTVTEGIKRPVKGMMATGLFIFLLHYFGFIIGIVIYFIIITIILNPKYSWRRLTLAIIQASILIITIYFLFGEFLNINLPTGIVFN